MIEVKNLVKNFGKNDEIKVLRGVNEKIENLQRRQKKGEEKDAET